MSPAQAIGSSADIACWSTLDTPRTRPPRRPRRHPARPRPVTPRSRPAPSSRAIRALTQRRRGWRGYCRHARDTQCGSPRVHRLLTDLQLAGVLLDSTRRTAYLAGMCDHDLPAHARRPLTTWFRRWVVRDQAHVPSSSGRLGSAHHSIRPPSYTATWGWPSRTRTWARLDAAGPAPQ